MFYQRLIRPLLFLLPAEAAHVCGALAMRLLTSLPGLAERTRRALAPSDPALVTHALGRDLPSPVGLAAGFDKDARLFDAALALGFGFVEVGTVTAVPQPGNDRPRLARLPGDRALLNRFGFNNAGAAAAGRALAARDPARGVVGANIGKSKVAPLDAAAADYRHSARAVAPHADFLVVNVSSPNTPGLRSLQDPESLRPILDAVVEAAPELPVLLKVAPDLLDGEVDALVDLALDLGLAGMIATNTTIDRGMLRDRAAADAAFEGGGISGAPLNARSLAVLRRIRARAGDRLLLVASGGIETAQDAWERVRAGATLLEVYTAFVYHGPLFAHRLGAELAALARAQGYARVQEAVGTEPVAAAR
ncbi:quinone-dependent dihydroorotate dehydrogenase [Capillimicrobium parvum]|nr:quinone-dependent dihydroorotate dehydrogenase [Capillimicrobium parvum]